MLIKVKRQLSTIIDTFKYSVSQEVETTLLNNVNICQTTDSPHELIIGVHKSQTSTYYSASLSINNGVCIDFQYEDECEEFLKLFTDFVA